MNRNPILSIVMPVFNAELYLRTAIESILQQSFRDYELLIIDDGSNDNSPYIISSYDDPRILFIENKRNIGVARTLNRGLQMAKGKYIARMDADDISMPERLAEQVAFMEANPSCSVLATRVALIDHHGARIGYWEEDLQTTSFRQIVQVLPRSNCIAHDSVVMQTSIAKKYMYNIKQIDVEDYDLWLRICSDGLKIEKINKILLLYRIYEQSVTSKSNRISGQKKKNLKTKLFFIKNRILNNKLSVFELKIIKYILIDFIKVYIL